MTAPARALVIYHDDCTDGACAAWSARYHLHRAGFEAELVPTHPGVTPDGVLGREWAHVFVVDVCIPRSDVEALGAWVLDHHKTNAPLLAGWERAVFDLSRSGAGLAWDEVQRVLWLDEWPRPWFVSYVEDRDLWRWALPQSREINAVLSLGKRSPEDFDAWTDSGLPEFVPWGVAEEGRAILRAELEAVTRACRHPLHGSLFGTVITHVASPVFQSEIGDVLSEREGMPACVWYVRLDEDRGPVVQVSLRSRDGLPDVSEIAAKLGGGGHRNAAGAVVPLVEWARRVGHWAGAEIPKSRRVFIASPLRGDIARNQAYAREALKDSLGRGEAPFVPHLLYDQVLRDEVPAERQQAIDAALVMLGGCDVLAVYTDLGVSAGMQGEIERAQALGLAVERREIRAREAA